MTIRVRTAAEADIDVLAELSRTARQRQAAWEPGWWSPSADADVLHPLWLGHLIATDGPVYRVVELDGRVVGGAVALPQAHQWFVDDLVVAGDGLWAGPGTALLEDVGQRPALTCVAPADVARRAAAAAAGLSVASRYWIGPPRASTMAVVDVPAGSPPPERRGAAPHTFGRAVDPAAEGALHVLGPDGGVLTGSPSLPAPPVFDPGGTVAVITEVTGPGRLALLGAGLAQAALRGDVLAAVVVATGDDELATACSSFDLHPAVEVLAWP